MALGESNLRGSGRPFGFWSLHNAWNELKLSESVPFMLFETHQKIQSHQISLSLSNDHIITFKDNHQFNDDGVIQLN